MLPICYGILAKQNKKNGAANIKISISTHKIS